MPRSAVDRLTDEPFELIVAVRDFVQAMLLQGLYRQSEISQRAMQAEHADNYLAEVNNGGHSQFIYNSGEDIDTVVANARAGLAAMGAIGQLAILEKMATWMAEHPDEAAEQTGFEGGIDDFLSSLDMPFYKEERAAPMLGLSARWIASWPELKIVDDDEYDEALSRLVMANPLREPRLLHRSIAKLASQMIGWRDVGAGLACAKASPPEIKMSFGMARMQQIEGEQQMVFYLGTSGKDPRLCVAAETHAAVYEYIAPQDPSVLLPGQSPFAAGIPRAGKRLARVEAPEIATVIRLAEEYHAPAAIDLLLRRAGFDPTNAIVSANSLVPKEDGAVVNWVVMADGHAFLLQSSPNGCSLMRGGKEESLAKAGRSELQEHFDRSAAAGQ